MKKTKISHQVDAVKMMRTLRTSLFNTYLKNPELMRKDLESVRTQYHFK